MKTPKETWHQYTSREGHQEQESLLHCGPKKRSEIFQLISQLIMSDCGESLHTCCAYDKKYVCKILIHSDNKCLHSNKNVKVEKFLTKLEDRNLRARFSETSKGISVKFSRHFYFTKENMCAKFDVISIS